VGSENVHAIMQQVFQVVRELVLNPLLYLSVVFIALENVRQAKVERKMFGVRVTRVWFPLSYRFLKFLLVGIVLTATAFSLHLSLPWRQIVLVSALSVILAAFRLRFLASVYSIVVWMLVAYLAATFHWYLVGISEPWKGALLNFSSGMWAAWIGLAGIGQVLMTWWCWENETSPALFRGKRGLCVGGFYTQYVYLLPIAPLPFLTGTSYLGATLFPKQVRIWTLWNGIGMFVAGGGAYALLRLEHLTFAPISLVALFVLAVELYILTLRVRERQLDSVCAPNADGVTILHTIRGSVARELGLSAGERIVEVNQSTVRSEYELHFALDINPAYVKMKVVDLRGEARLVGKPIYAGERHQIGLLIVSVEDGVYVYKRREVGALSSLYARWGRLTEGGATISRKDMPTLAE
jgi:hypothetical protein